MMSPKVKGRVSNRKIPAMTWERIVCVAKPTTNPPKEPTVNAAARFTLKMDVANERRKAMPDMRVMVRRVAAVG